MSEPNPRRYEYHPCAPATKLHVTHAEINLIALTPLTHATPVLLRQLVRIKFSGWTPS